jgi:hypothetical protein
LAVHSEPDWHSSIKPVQPGQKYDLAAWTSASGGSLSDRMLTCITSSTVLMNVCRALAAIQP